MPDPDDDGLPVVGTDCSVDFAQWSRTARTRKAWRKLGDKIQPIFEIRFQILADGNALPFEQFRRIGDGIYEFKCPKPAWRIGAFKHNNMWWLTHVFKKPFGNRKFQNEVNRANKAKAEHLSGNYTDE